MYQKRWRPMGALTTAVLLGLLLLLPQSLQAAPTTKSSLQEINFSIDLEVTVGTEAEVCAESDSITVTPDTTVYYCFTAINTGNRSLRVHDLVDSQLGVILDDFSLFLEDSHGEDPPGEDSVVSIISDPVTITSTVTNTATWSAYRLPTEPTVSDTDTATVTVEGEPPAPMDATVSVGHFAPFADSVAGTSVTVRVNGMETFTEFEFGNVITDVTLPEGEYLIEVLPTGTETVAISGSVVLTGGVDYTLAAIGDGVNQPLELFPLVDDNEPLANLAKLRVGHLAPFADTPAGTQVDICTDEGDIVPGLEAVAYKDVATLPLPAGTYDLLIALAGTGCADVALDLPPVALAEGDVADLFAIGNIVNLPLQIATTTGLNVVDEPPAPMDATVSVGHFAPFADSVAGTSVTVRVNGMETFTEFEFGNVITDVTLPQGEYLIEVLPTGTETVAISGSVVLTGGVDYTLAAIGDGVNQPLELFPLVDDNEPLANLAKLRVGHLAPFADALAGTQVDICTDEGDIVPGLEAVAYKDVATLPLPAGTYDLLIALAGTGCADVALDLPPVALAEGDVADLFAIGNIVNLPLQIATTTGLNVVDEPPAPMDATVSVAHLAPFAESIADTSVTVRINGEDAITGFVFGDVVSDVPLAPGEYLIEVLPTGTETVAISGTVTLEEAASYLVAAIGDGDNQPLSLFVLRTDVAGLSPEAGMGAIQVAHAAPIASALAETAVDICTADGQVAVAGLQYSQAQTLMLPAASYDLSVAAAGTNCEGVLLDLPPLELVAGAATSVMAFTNLEDDALNAVVVNASVQGTEGPVIVAPVGIDGIFMPLIIR